MTNTGFLPPAIDFRLLPLPRRHCFAYRQPMPVSLSQQFDVFAQLVATGGIAASGRALNLPAAIIIETMDRLEDRIGFQIFRVADGNVELTEAGRKLVRALGELPLDAPDQWMGALTGMAVAGQTSLPEPDVMERHMATALTVPEVVETILPVRAPPATPAAVSQMPVTENPVEDTDPAPLATPRHFEPHDRQASEPVETIILASHPAIFSHFQEALVAFEQASPDIGITLRLESIDEDEAARLFHEKLADIAYYYAIGEPRHFTSRYAWSERVSLFASRDHPLAMKDAVLADDLSALSYAALAPENMTRRLVEQALADSGLGTDPPALETDNLYEIMKFVESNSAFFAAFGPMARDFGRMSGITRLSYAQSLPQIQVRQAVRPDRMHDPAILALSEFLFR